MRQAYVQVCTVHTCNNLKSFLSVTFCFLKDGALLKEKKMEKVMGNVGYSIKILSTLKGKTMLSKNLLKNIKLTEFIFLSSVSWTYRCKCLKI